jgi:hypothetical protein
LKDVFVLTVKRLRKRGGSMEQLEALEDLSLRLSTIARHLIDVAKEVSDLARKVYQLIEDDRLIEDQDGTVYQ